MKTALSSSLKQHFNKNDRRKRWNILGLLYVYSWIVKENMNWPEVVESMNLRLDFNVLNCTPQTNDVVNIFHKYKLLSFLCSSVWLSKLLLQSFNTFFFAKSFTENAEKSMLTCPQEWTSIESLPGLVTVSMWGTGLSKRSIVVSWNVFFTRTYSMWFDPEHWTVCRWCVFFILQSKH